MRRDTKTKISETEKLTLFKTADEQLKARIHNSKGENIERLIEHTFDRLDIEVLASKFIKAKKKEVVQFLNYAQSIDPLEKIHARELLKKDRELEVWSYSDAIGYKLELNKLCEEFKRGRLN